MHCYHTRYTRALLSILAFVGAGSAACACGYSVNTTEDHNHAVFTDLFESEFLHITDVTFTDSFYMGWQPQNYTQPKSDGPNGMLKESRNLIPNFIANHNNWVGNGVVGGDPGLQLWVRSSLIQQDGQQLVPSAEIVSERDDILYGSFRIAMKTTSVSGTCGAFYYYQNDSQEIDLEILSAELHHTPSQGWPIHLVVQNTTKAPTQRNDVSSWLTYHLPSAPDADYNEYRFDWLPNRIDYFVNSQWMWSITESIPSTPGRIHISHWSDGNPFWSQGPPKEDAVMTVSYVKAYFNSTNTTRTSEYDTGCPSTSPGLANEICRVPDQTSAPNPFGPHGNETGHTYFFTQQHNMTVNQTLYMNDAARTRSMISKRMWLVKRIAILYTVFAINPLLI